MHTMRIWTARLFIGIVTAWNLQAAVAFIASPDRFVHAFELAGTAGEAAVRGMGVLFLMWNLPYATALLHPLRFRLALILATGMQFIGLIGESYIRCTLPPGYAALSASISRFIAFDGAGLILLAAAWWIAQKETWTN